MMAEMAAGSLLRPAIPAEPLVTTDVLVVGGGLGAGALRRQARVCHPGTLFAGREASFGALRRP